MTAIGGWANREEEETEMMMEGDKSADRPRRNSTRWPGRHGGPPPTVVDDKVHNPDADVQLHSQHRPSAFRFAVLRPGTVASSIGPSTCVCHLLVGHRSTLLQERSPTINEKPQGKDDDYGDSSSKLWSVYLSVADSYDKSLVERWKADMDGILIFTGLFSTTVAAFVIESYKSLQQDPKDVTVQILDQISQQLVSIANGTTPSLPPRLPPFEAPSSMLRVNVFGFLSLVVSVTCALGAILVQQWSRKYLSMTTRASAPHRRARVRALLHQGMEKYGLSTVSEIIPLFLHVAVFLFFAGLVQFLFIIHATLAYCVLAALSLVASMYLFLTIIPVISIKAPYATPLSQPVWYLTHTLYSIILLLIFIPFNAVTPWSRRTSRIFNKITASRLRLKEGFMRGLERQASSLVDVSALEWLTRFLSEDAGLLPFIEGIPGILRSTLTFNGAVTLTHVLKKNSLGSRIGTLMMAFAHGNPVAEPVRVHHALACLDAVWELTAAYNGHMLEYWQLDPSRRLVIAVRGFRHDPDPTVSVLAHCTTMLRVVSVLHSCRRTQDEHRREEILTWIPTSVKETCDTFETSVMTDGLLVTSTLLVYGILPMLDKIQESRLNMVWETVRLLCRSLHAGRASPQAQRLFANMLKNAVLRSDNTSARDGPHPSSHETLVQMLVPVAARIEDAEAVHVIAEAMGPLESVG